MKAHHWNLTTKRCQDCGIPIAAAEADRTIFCVDRKNSLRKIPVAIPAGAIFTVTAGYYSDNSVDGVFKALKDIDTYNLRNEWRAQKGTGFVAWLLVRDFMEQVPAFELRLGDDGDDDTVWPPEV